MTTARFYSLIILSLFFSAVSACSPGAARHIVPMFLREGRCAVIFLFYNEYRTV
jgi:hypothetical protein